MAAKIVHFLLILDCIGHIQLDVGLALWTNELSISTKRWLFTAIPLNNSIGFTFTRGEHFGSIEERLCHDSSRGDILSILIFSKLTRVFYLAGFDSSHVPY